MYTSLERRTANCAHTRTRQLEAQAAIVGAHEPADLLLQRVAQLMARLQRCRRELGALHALVPLDNGRPRGVWPVTEQEAQLTRELITRVAPPEVIDAMRPASPVAQKGHLRRSNLDCESTATRSPTGARPSSKRSLVTTPGEFRLYSYLKVLYPTTVY